MFSCGFIEAGLCDVHMDGVVREMNANVSELGWNWSVRMSRFEIHQLLFPMTRTS